MWSRAENNTIVALPADVGRGFLRLGWISQAIRSPIQALFVGFLILVIGGCCLVGCCYLGAAWHFRAAQRDLEKRDGAKAQEHLPWCLKIWSSSPEVHLLAARAARYAGDYDLASDHLDTCNSLKKGWDAQTLERALLRAHRGDLDRFTDDYLQSLILTGHKDSSLILEALAWGYQKVHRYPQAIICLDIWLKREPESAPAWFQRGQLFETVEDHVEGEKNYHQALAIDQHFFEARLRLANLVQALARPEEALADYQILDRAQPDNLDVLRGLANCYFQLGRIVDARRFLDQVLAHDPNDGPGLRLRGHLEVQAGEPADAEMYLRRAVQQMQDDPQPCFDLAICLRQQDKLEEARRYQHQAEQTKADMDRLRELTRKMAEAPHDADLRYQAAQIFLARGLDQEGLTWLKSALHEDPRHRSTHQALADHYRRAGDAAQSAYHRRRALESKESL
jgi:tetratricopeptide (TPR) repeat protein